MSSDGQFGLGQRLLLCGLCAVWAGGAGWCAAEDGPLGGPPARARVVTVENPRADRCLCAAPADRAGNGAARDYEVQRQVECGRRLAIAGFPQGCGRSQGLLRAWAEQRHAPRRGRSRGAGPLEGGTPGDQHHHLGQAPGGFAPGRLFPAGRPLQRPPGRQLRCRLRRQGLL